MLGVPVVHTLKRGWKIDKFDLLIQFPI